MALSCKVVDLSDFALFKLKNGEMITIENVNWLREIKKDGQILRDLRGFIDFPKVRKHAINHTATVERPHFGAKTVFSILNVSAPADLSTIKPTGFSKNSTGDTKTDSQSSLLFVPKLTLSATKSDLNRSRMNQLSDKTAQIRNSPTSPRLQWLPKLKPQTVHQPENKRHNMHIKHHITEPPSLTIN
ncbi:hypothetical protein V202x_06740 [Gimesia aquarii]|uniref:Uncharacterized protein n=2 Tax=Gimesia aquarii TaxID=2527964 RepID=A0A517WPX8_9PLAN|nr:hypothetical protein V202x_06740 [Gimesia aquarii]